MARTSAASTVLDPCAMAQWHKMGSFLLSFIIAFWGTTNPYLNLINYINSGVICPQEGELSFGGTRTITISASFFSAPTPNFPWVEARSPLRERTTRTDMGHIGLWAHADQRPVADRSPVLGGSVCLGSGGDRKQ